MSKTVTTLKEYRFWMGANGTQTGGIPVSGQTLRVMPANSVRITEDNLPDWRGRLKRGESATTTLDGTRIRRSFDYGRMDYLNSFGQAGVYYGVILNQMVDIEAFNSPSLETKADNLASEAFIKNYRNITRSFQGGVFLGELFETARMLARPGKALRKEVGNVFGDLKRLLDRASRRPGKASTKGLLEGLNDTWLEWNYGVKPLVSDLDDMSLTLRRLAAGRTFDMVRITGDGEATGSVSSQANLSVSLGPAGSTVPHPVIACARDRVDTSQVRYTYGWKCSTPTGEVPLTQTIGLSLSDFVPTVWELIPYSFLVDYFSNIGSVLDALSVQHVTFAWGQRTVRNSRTCRAYGLVPLKAIDDKKAIAYGGNVSLVHQRVHRTRMLSAPMPALQLRVPGMESTKWVNIMALINGRADARRSAARLG